MSRGVEDFAYKMMTQVFNAKDTAPLGIQAILDAGSCDLGPMGSRIEDPSEWTDSKIVERAKALSTDKGAKGNFDD